MAHWRVSCASSKLWLSRAGNSSANEPSLEIIRAAPSGEGLPNDRLGLKFAISGSRSSAGR